MRYSDTSAANRSGQVALFPELFRPSHTASHTDESRQLDSLSDKQHRVIHYLGSKLRLLDAISDALSTVTPLGGSVCDLFAGSGAVSVNLKNAWRMIAVDIQEYSRVLCNGLLNPPSDGRSIAQALIGDAYRSDLRCRLRASFEPLLSLELEAVSKAAMGDPIPLCDLLEVGSLVAFEHENSQKPPDIARAMRQALAGLKYHSLGAGPETVISRYFGGLYFSWEQAIDFDSLLNQVHGLNESDRDFYLAAVLATASDVVNTVGKHFAQPIKLRDSDGNPKRHLVKQTVKDRTLNVFRVFEEWVSRFDSIPRSEFKHLAIRSDYLEFLCRTDVEFDAVYADPPYTRDHYSRYYHVLETMSRYDVPEISRTLIHSDGRPKLSRGLYRVDRHQSPFCIKSRAPGAVEELCRAVSDRGIPLVLSYSPYNSASRSRPRLLSIDEISAIASKYFNNIECIPVDGVAHNKLNTISRNVETDNVAEVIFICTHRT